MERIGASEARRHLPRLLDRVRAGREPDHHALRQTVARLVPIAHDRERAQQVAVRILERRRHPKRVPMADLMGTICEVHRQCQQPVGM